MTGMLSTAGGWKEKGIEAWAAGAMLHLAEHHRGKSSLPWLGLKQGYALCRAASPLLRGKWGFAPAIPRQFHVGVIGKMISQYYLSGQELAPQTQ
uniref:Uncharacterized protein n=1 Tax=Sphaerodactylus townsendi TaxID=933632 RepID=A0ACB8G7G4_9SAUR